MNGFVRSYECTHSRMDKFTNRIEPNRWQIMQSNYRMFTMRASAQNVTLVVFGMDCLALDVEALFELCAQSGKQAEGHLHSSNRAAKIAVRRFFSYTVFRIDNRTFTATEITCETMRAFSYAQTTASP